MTTTNEYGTASVSIELTIEINGQKHQFATHTDTTAYPSHVACALISSLRGTAVDLNTLIRSPHRSGSSWRLIRLVRPTSPLTTVNVALTTTIGERTKTFDALAFTDTDPVTTTRGLIRGICDSAWDWTYDQR